MSKTNIDNEDDFTGFPTTSYVQKDLGSGNTLYDFLIHGAIKDIGQYDDLVFSLREAVEGDIVQISLSSEGGALTVSEFIVNEISRSDATVVVVVDSECASAATSWLLAADQAIVDPNASFLFHEASYGPGINTASNIEDAVEHSKELIDRWLNRHYTGFLTDEEIQKLRQGKQLYMFGDEVVERLKNREESRRAEFEEQEVFDEMEKEVLDKIRKRVNMALKKKS